MLEKGEKLPSLQEANEETGKRLEIIEKIVPQLTGISEVIILVGSMAYGQNYSVRKASDIDLVVLIDRAKIDEVLTLDLFHSDQLKKDAIAAFKSKVSDVFTLIEEIEGIEVHFHFWDKEVHYKLQVLEPLTPKYFDPIIKTKDDFAYAYDFRGERVNLKIPATEKFKSGFLQSFSAFVIDKDRFIPRVVTSNLLSRPLILYSKNDKIHKNLDILWQKVAERLIYESKYGINLKERNVLNSLYGSWNFSPEVRRMIEQRTLDEFQKLNRKL